MRSRVHLWKTGALVLSLTIILAGAPVAAQDASPAAEPATSHAVFLPLVQRDFFFIQPFAAEVIRLTNEERARANPPCSPLTANAILMQAAQAHSQNMALNDFFSHSGFPGRIQALGYRGWLGENIAAGYPTPVNVVAGWMASSGHKANILNCGYREIGVGYYFLANDTGSVNHHHYWTQDFGTP